MPRISQRLRIALMKTALVLSLGASVTEFYLLRSYDTQEKSLPVTFMCFDPAGHETKGPYFAECRSVSYHPEGLIQAR